MQKRYSVMVNSNLYQEIKRIKASLLLKENIELKNLGEVIEFIVNYYKEREEGYGTKKVS